MSVFRSRCRDHGGLELSTLKGFEFSSDQIQDAVRSFGYDYVPSFTDRPHVLRTSQSNLIVRTEKRDTDAPPPGHRMTDSRRHWEIVVGNYLDTQEVDLEAFDDRIRCIEIAGRSDNWTIRKKNREWTRKSVGTVKMILQSEGHTKTEAEQKMGRVALHPWRLTSIPFAPEEDIAKRTWNLDAPQYRYKPSPGPHPNWDMIFDHVGLDLTPHLPALAWAQACNIVTGGDYMRAIYASILREPFEPTPYLFSFGPENSGKSIYHEAFEILVTRGVVKADRALTSQSDFNGELAGCIMAVVEEKDISKTPGAYAKIKDAVTSRNISIRKMHCDSFDAPNTTHWVQCSNHIDACPRGLGDTRILCLHVPALKREVPKTELLVRLQAEAPQIMHTLMTMRLPQQAGRLRIPLVETEASRLVADRNTDDRVKQLIELASDVKSWEGTAPELSDLLADQAGDIQRLPRDFRTLWRFLETHRFALVAAKVSFAEVKQNSKHKGTKHLSIKAAA